MLRKQPPNRWHVGYTERGLYLKDTESGDIVARGKEVDELVAKIVDTMRVWREKHDPQTAPPDRGAGRP